MKKALLAVAALTLASGAAFASDARVNALGGAAHLTDTTGIYTNPSDLHKTGDFVSAEFGGTEEAAFVKTMGDYKLGFGLNHKSAYTHGNMIGRGYAGQQNPFQVFYGAKSGDMNWAGSFSYSSVDSKDAGQKASAMGVTFGASTEAWDAYAKLGLGSSAEGTGDINNDGDVTDPGEGDADAKYTGTSGMVVGGGMNSGSIYYYGSYAMDGFKTENTAADEEEGVTQMKLGMVNSTKADGVEFFYGLSYEMTESKDKAADTSATATALPFLVGIEADAAPWLVLRGSVTQNLPFVTENKTDTGSAGNIGESTAVAAGAGFKFGKATIDMELSMGGTGNVESDDIGSNASLTYMF